ncbi:RNA polymerase sigma factor [Chitinophaga japonensis]|uniref:RNA polymerase sigma-70 factor (ECF subfamily) n=1 Tax=Chitinophaga japonensis TaxID=104662 RepID=A0A562TDR3_CHIJA|nr:sigma-70 family RNA polymerase sigma factor [Chitinophaga japonensis]TWI91130.1 RNA polymerase sigma-70 factor (ECF subfamily) [Chitinophaga japonensis]
MDDQQLLAIIRQHQPMLYKICRLYRDTREDREDLFQEIVYQVWKAYPAYRAEAKVSSWIYRIALNTALAAFRKRAPPVIYRDSLPEQAADPEDARQELQEQLFAALKQLSDADRALMALYLEDLSYQEIAAITGIAENYVGVKLHRIRNRIKTLLKL